MEDSQHNSNKTKKLSVEQPDNSNIDISRRQFSRLGAVSPVLLTLASKPVFGGNCLSNMMSGNLSDPDRGNCSPGWSPGGWRKPVGQINGINTLDAWTETGYTMGTLTDDDLHCEPGGTGFKIPGSGGCYINGTTYNDTPLPGGDSRTLLEILWTNDHKKFYITAYLNALLSQASGNFNYVLTPQQVINVINNPSLVQPMYASAKDYFDWSWNYQD